jgi:hypothetical protein
MGYSRIDDVLGLMGSHSLLLLMVLLQLVGPVVVGQKGGLVQNGNWVDHPSLLPPFMHEQVCM